MFPFNRDNNGKGLETQQLNNHTREKGRLDPTGDTRLGRSVSGHQ